MGICRSCGAQIDWIELKSGKKMPVDKRPVSVLQFGKEGKEKYTIVYSDGIVESVGLNDGLRGDATAYFSHFSTCPQADQWRKA
jgi:hypothetical protein